MAQVAARTRPEADLGSGRIGLPYPSTSEPAAATRAPQSAGAVAAALVHARRADNQKHPITLKGLERQASESANIDVRPRPRDMQTFRRPRPLRRRALPAAARVVLRPRHLRPRRNAQGVKKRQLVELLTQAATASAQLAWMVKEVPVATKALHPRRPQRARRPAVFEQARLGAPPPPARHGRRGQRR